jgi:geranylgeranyl reductase
MSLSTKVLVVGGGPAGSTAAKILAEHGIEVILIERNLSFRKPCGGGIPYASFDEFGIPKTTIIHHVKSVSIVSPQGRKVKIPLKGGGLAIVDRQQFDMMLRAQAEESGARLSECEFKGMIREKLYSIETKAGSEKSGIRAEYVIAADGIHSRVRAAFGIKPVQSLFAASEHIEGVQSSACEFWFGSASERARCAPLTSRGCLRGSGRGEGFRETAKARFTISRSGKGTSFIAGKSFLPETLPGRCCLLPMKASIMR